MSRVTILNLKALRTAEYRRKSFYNNFEHGRERRNLWYKRLKPRLNINSRNLIEKHKIELKRKKTRSLDRKRKSSSAENPSSYGSLGGSKDMDDFITSFETGDNHDDNKPAVSRRSSLRSSLIDGARNASFDSMNTEILQRCLSSLNTGLN